MNVMAYLALLAGLLSIGFSAIFVRAADAPGTVSAFYRMAIATFLVGLPFLWQARLRKYRFSRLGIWLAVLGGLFFAVDLTFWATGITLSGATTPTLMANTAPLWVGLGALLVFHERQGRLFWIGLGIAMAGAAMVLGQDLALTADIGMGTFLGLLAAIFYGGYYLITQRGRDHLSTLAYFWIATFSASLALLSLNLALARPLVGYSSATYLNFLGLGVITQALGWLVINYAQGYLSASVVAPTLLGQPVLTAIIAVLLLGERFTVWHVLGGIAVLAGVYLVHRSRLANQKLTA